MDDKSTNHKGLRERIGHFIQINGSFTVLSPNGRTGIAIAYFDGQTEEQKRKQINKYRQLRPGRRKSGGMIASNGILFDYEEISQPARQVRQAVVLWDALSNQYFVAAIKGIAREEILKLIDKMNYYNKAKKQENERIFSYPGFPERDTNVDEQNGQHPFVIIPLLVTETKKKIPRG